MRPITRNFLLGLLVVVVLLLALGALPGLLKSGDPFYLTASPVDPAETNYTAEDAINASDLSEQRFEFTATALANATDGTGWSDPYWRGPVGIKGAFTHSPFDELASMRTAYPEASDGETALVRANGTFYRLEVVQR
jgi:hypothetical protein